MSRKTNTPKSGGALTVDQVRERFHEEGRSFAEFARENGFSERLVYSVLKGRGKGLRGQSHNIAVALGIKQGQRTDARPSRQKAVA